MGGNVDFGNVSWRVLCNRCNAVSRLKIRMICDEVSWVIVQSVVSWVVLWCSVLVWCSVVYRAMRSWA